MKVCERCQIYTKGRGEYSFRYLDETVYLCGRCAQKVMDYIKGSLENEKK